MTTSMIEFDRWLGVPREGEHLEFKEAKTQCDADKLFRYCVALANEGGGKFILGVSDRRPRQVVGSQALRDPADMKSKILDKLGFRVEIEELAHPDGRVVIVHVPPRPSGTAYHCDGAYLMRSGENLRPMSEDRLRANFAEGQPEWLAQPARQGVTSDDVVRLLETSAYFDLLEIPYPVHRDGVLERFASERMIARDDSGYTIFNLGALLFAKRLDDFDGLGRRAPRVVVYAGQGKMETRLDRHFTRGYAAGFRGLIDFINDATQPNEVIGRAVRREVKMYPAIAIRELVANALIHQDFSEAGMSVMIEVYPDRMEIVNPGKPSIPPDRFIDEYQSRNERLADVMRRLGICEEKGSGIDKVIQSVEVFQLPAPDFRVGLKRTSAVLFSHQDFEDMGRKDRVRACYQHCCLCYVTNRRMTNQGLRERFDLPDERAETASRIIQDTIRGGLIKMDDPMGKSKRYAKYLPFWA